MNRNNMLELLLKYPLINTIKNGDQIIYRGCIYVNEKDYEIYIKQYVNNQNDFKLCKTLDLEPYLLEIDNAEKLNFKSIMEVLDFIKSVIERRTLDHKLKNQTDIFQKVLNEYYELTRFYFNFKLCEISDDLKFISIIKSDERNCEHFLRIAIDYNETRDIFVVDCCDIPENPQNMFFKKFDNLTALYEHFQSTIDILQPFWDLMNIFDSNCHILDPESPKKCDKHRRIWMDDSFSIVITVDPFNIHSTPDIKFLGPETLVEKFRLKINTNLVDWQTSSDIFQEILSLLGLESFPLKNNVPDANTNILINEGECSICFSYRLDDHLPEIVCTNKSCQNVYHIQCLYEWLIALKVEWFFTEVTGQCPNCEKSISCPIPEHLRNQ